MSTFTFPSCLGTICVVLHLNNSIFQQNKVSMQSKRNKLLNMPLHLFYEPSSSVIYYYFTENSNYSCIVTCYQFSSVVKAEISRYADSHLMFCL